MKTVLVDKDVFRKMRAEMRQDIRRGVCTKAETLLLLGLSESDFKREKASPESKLIKSKKQGRWIWSSIKAEFKRIHGVSYEEAIK
ncbi:hypothetical protein [Flagellimonas nanhaiensis]|uniref:Uncharacterized protein n=1 Tax=Flagellimonas nanhaiensis TaxID=2292706 RepID=A0A371JMV8_9FLAO|nr:hypothetical protein [Allomuricauda nanhaiensis]RDY58470.1 hypothetical protein DX873_15835 [Allomuricauda nanhaiensis]